MNKKTLISFLEYAAGNVFNKLILLFFIPIFTAFFVPEEYAVYSNLLIFIALSLLIYSLGIQQSIFSHFYDRHSDDYHFTFISSVFITLSLSGIIFTGLIFLFRSSLSQLILRTTAYEHLFWLVGVIIFFDSFYTMSLNFFNILEESRYFALISSVRTVLLLLSFCVLAFSRNFTLNSVFFVTAIASGIASVTAFLFLQKIISRKHFPSSKYFSSALMKQVLSFGIVMIPGTFAMLALRLADRYMITYLSSSDVNESLHQVGIYALGYRIGMIMQFAVSLISLVYFPYAMKIADKEWAAQFYRKLFHRYLLAGSIFACLIMLFANDLFRIFVDQSYHAALSVVGYGVISSFLTGLFNLLNIHFYLKKKANIIAGTVIVGASLNILLNLFMIPKWGLYGAGTASIIAYVFIVAIQFWQAERLHRVGYNFLLAISVILFLCFFMIIRPIYYTESPSLIVLKIIILGLSIVAGSIWFHKSNRSVRS